MTIILDATANEFGLNATYFVERRYFVELLRFLDAHPELKQSAQIVVKEDMEIPPPYFVPVQPTTASS